MIKKKALISRNTVVLTFILLILLISMLNTNVIADNNFIQKNDSIEVGEVFRFKYEKLRVNGSSEDVEITLTSTENYLNNITIREGAIVIVNVTNTYAGDVSQIRISLEDSNHSILSSGISLSTYFFIPYSIDAYYQGEINQLEESKRTGSIETYEYVYDNTTFYTKIKYNEDSEENIFEYSELEVYIPKHIVRNVEFKFINDIYRSISSFQLNYDHIKIVSLDYPPEYSKNKFDLGEFLIENFVSFITNPFFYVILAEIGGLLFLFKFIKRRTKKG